LHSYPAFTGAFWRDTIRPHGKQSTQARILALLWEGPKRASELPRCKNISDTIAQLKKLLNPVGWDIVSTPVDVTTRLGFHTKEMQYERRRIA
jgi:hypothetical protein